MKKHLRIQVKILKRIKKYRKQNISSYIFGLGNPGSRYHGTLHNAGFMVVDLLAEKQDLKLSEVKGNTLFTTYLSREGNRVFLGKPKTYMNQSGEAIRYFLGKKDLQGDKVIVVHDDMDIAPGKIKLKRGGGSGGHRGVESVAEALAWNGFIRVRVGIGRPSPDMDPTDYVLLPPTEDMNDKFLSGIIHATDAIITILAEGAESAFCYYNSAMPYEKN